MTAIPSSKMSAIDLMLTRRSVRLSNLSDPGPDKEQLDTILTAALRVPDHGKLTPWRFIVLDREARTELMPKLSKVRRLEDPDVSDEFLGKVEAAFVVAPLCIVVVCTADEGARIPAWEQHLSVGASAMNLIIASHALGFGAQWLTGWNTYNDKAKALFGVATDELVAGFIHIGTPTEAPSDRPRPKLEDYVAYGV